MIAESVVELSRWQFAITAALHLLFVPLTLGLALLLALMESAFVMTGREIYKAMARFWARVFAINFVLAVSTRLLVLFQFGMNGSYFSHYVGDIFALPLALEALTSFVLAAALFGPYWCGWDVLSRKQHLLITWFMAFAVNVSAYWIVVAYSWLQNPIAASFNYQSYRMESTDLTSILANPVVVANYCHAVAAAFVITGATIAGISAFRLRRHADDSVSRSSFKWAVLLGLLVCIVNVWPGLALHPRQDTQAVPDGKDTNALLPAVVARVRNGMEAYALLQQLRDDDKSPDIVTAFEQHKLDLGYALLLLPVHKQILGASEKQIRLVAQSALPAHPGLMQWGYRLIPVMGGLTLLWLLAAAFFALRAEALPGWLLSVSQYLAVTPWLTFTGGGLLAEIGTQPWAVDGILPVFLSVSSLSTKELVLSLLGYVAGYGVLLLAGLYLLRQAIAVHPVSADEV